MRSAKIQTCVEENLDLAGGEGRRLESDVRGKNLITSNKGRFHPGFFLAATRQSVRLDKLSVMRWRRWRTNQVCFVAVSLNCQAQDDS